MDPLSSLPTPLLAAIHRLVYEAGGLRDALSLEAASKGLNARLRAHARLPYLEVPSDTLQLQSTQSAAALWRFVALHGHRVDRISFPGYSRDPALPLLSGHEGVDRIRSVAVSLRWDSSIHDLEGLRNLHTLSCYATPESSAMEALQGMTSVQSLSLHYHSRMSLHNDSHNSSIMTSLPALSNLSTALSSLELLSVPCLTSMGFQPCHARNLKRLTLSDLRAVTTLDLISCLTSLTALTLSHLFVLHHGLAPLSSLQNLQHLRMHHIRSGPGQHGQLEFGPSPLSGLQSLSTLRMISCDIQSLCPIATLGSTLRELLVAACRVTDVSAVEAFSALRLLWLSRILGNSFTNMDCLRHLTSLEVLGMKQCGVVSSLEPIGTFSATMTKVVISSADGVSSLAPLSRLRSLRSLYLEFLDNVRELDPVSNLTALRQLRVCGMKEVSSLAPLSRASLLEALDLTGLPNVSSLQPISDLAALKRLQVQNTSSVSTLEPLSTLRTLQRLRVGQLTVSTLEPLSTLCSLQHLNVALLTVISTLNPLSALTGLHDLVVKKSKYMSTVTPRDAQRTSSQQPLHISNLHNFPPTLETGPPIAIPGDALNS
jgi:hypothetical protein